MTREEAIERIKARSDKWALDNEDMKAIQTIIPELRESEDEKIRKAIESIIHVYGKTQGEWIAGYDMDTLVVHLRNAFAWLDSLPEQPKPKPMNIPSGGCAMGTTPPSYKSEVKKQPVDEPEYYQHFDPDC